MPSTPPYLPQELVDSIIDYVNDDRSTLYSCALVSRSWLHSSRLHLFASIALSPHTQCKASPQKLCQRLYQVLQESPDIIPYIRNLQVLDGGNSPNLRSGQWIINERTLPPLLKLLTHLRQFELGASSSGTALQWKSLPFTLQNAVCTVLKLSSLTFFRLHSWTFPNLVSLAAVTSSCQNLKGLSLYSITVNEELDHHSVDSPTPTRPIIIPPPQLPHLDLDDTSPDSERPVGGTAPNDSDSKSNHPDDKHSSGSNTVTTRVAEHQPHLEALTLDYVNFGYLGYWLFAPSQSPSPINFSNLRELRISHSADPLVVEQVLLSIGLSLEHLHLKPGSWDVFSFDLRNNSNLKSLKLTLEDPDTALGWCTTLLSSLSPSGFASSTTSSSSSSPSPSSSLSLYPKYDLQLTHISLEFWTDLKKLNNSSSSSSTSSASSSLSNSPNRSSPSLLPSSSPLSSTSSLPLGGGSTSTTSSPSTSFSSSPNLEPRTPSRTNTKRSLPPTQPTWSCLDSILSFLPTPLHQVDVGLFAQPSSPDFIRVKETLRGIHARMQSDRVIVSDELSLRMASGSAKEEGDGDEEGERERKGGKVEEEKECENEGIVRVYQLGLKSQRSFGRICGPRLRSFEGI